MEILFYIFAVLSMYSYFLYPLILKILPERKSADTGVDSQRDSDLPFLSLIITVHNEAGRIRGKLDNTLKNDYPPELLEIIVASDFSSDESHEWFRVFIEVTVKRKKIPLITFNPLLNNKGVC